MKIVPLARKVRLVTRRADDREIRPRQTTRWITLAIVFILTVLITSPSVWVPPLPTEPGTEITSPVVAEAGFRWEPPDMREQWEQRRIENYTRVFEWSPETSQQAIDRIANVIEAARSAGDRELDPDEARARLAEIDAQFAVWNEDDIQELVALAQIPSFRRNARNVLMSLTANALVALEPDAIRFRQYEDNRQIITPSGSAAPDPTAILLEYPNETNVRLSNLTRELLQESLMLRADGETGDLLQTDAARVAMRALRLGIVPNLTFDEEASLRQKESFPPPQPEYVQAGEILVPRGMTETRLQTEGVAWPHMLTAGEAALLNAYRPALAQVRLMKFGAQMLFVLVAFLIISFFVIKFSRELGFNTTTILLLALPVLLALGLGRVFLLLAGEGDGYAGYAFPAGVIGILGVLLLDVRLAILLVTWGCLLFGLEADLEYEFVIVGLFGGYTAVAALYNFRERREVLYAGLLIGFVNAATITIIHFIGDSQRDLLTAAGIGALAGILCSLISFAVLPVFEVLFKITTDMQLLELSGLQHPLLKRMEEVAPGTLQHTLNVAKLAESAAQVIGVNYLLVRAGCYFHDIGKMAKPEYFTENQMTAEDKKRHNELKPQMSTLIIRNHVKEGLELARKHKLPPSVVAFIAEHHGTTLIEYFYRKAQTQYEAGESKEPPREQEYRYPGPRPQTIESALVMLADTVEATATAKLSSRTVREEDIQQIVRHAITSKFNDGQFDNCNLTLRDLNIIRESFIKTLRSRFHQRIDYPAPAGSEKKKDIPKDTSPKRPKTKADESLIDADDLPNTTRQVATTG